MKLKRLKLENFRQHRQTEVEFQDGMTAILGANGCGKTTLLEAITYALYGKQRGNRDTLATLGSNEKIRVELEFQIQDRVFVLERGDKRVELSEKLGALPIELAEGATAVNAAVVQLLGIGYKHFINSFCAEQKKLSFLGGDDDKQRQKEVAKMLRLDRLEHAVKDATVEKKRLESEAKLIAENVTDLEAAREALKLAEQGLLEAQASLQETDDALKRNLEEGKNLHKQNEQAKNWKLKRDELARLKESLVRLEQEVSKAELALKEKTELLAKKQELQFQENEYQQSVQKRKELEAARSQSANSASKRVELELLQKQLIEHEQKKVDFDLKAHEALEQEAKKLKLELEAKQSQRTQELAKVQETVTQLRTQIALQEDQLQKDRELLEKGLCPTCEQPLGASFQEKATSLDRAIAGLKQDLIKAEQIHAELEAQSIEELQKQVDEANEKHKRSEESKAAAARWQNEQQKFQKRIDQISSEVTTDGPQFSQADLDAVNKQIEALETDHIEFLKLAEIEHQHEKAQQELDQAKAELDKQQAKTKTLNEELASFEIESEEVAQETLEKYEQLKLKNSELQGSIKGLTSAVVASQKRLTDAKKNFDEAKDSKAKVEAARRGSKHYEHVAKGMEDLRKSLNASLRPHLQARASEHLSRLTDGRFVELRLDEKFSPIVVDENQDLPIISGGEEDVVALSLRLALSELIQDRIGQPMSLLILDEVFGSLDEQRRNSALQLLDAMKGSFQQILVISHIDEIHQVADQCLYLRRDPDSQTTTVRDTPWELADLKLTDEFTLRP